MAVTFDQRHVGPGAFRGDRGRDARRTGAEHQHVGLVQDGKFPARLDHLAVDDRGAGPIAEHLVAGDHVALKAAGLTQVLGAGLSVSDQSQSGRHSRGSQHSQQLATVHRFAP